MCGVWEHLICSVKVLSKACYWRHARLDSSSAVTALHEVMSLVNSQHLSPCVFHDEEPLTPNHLLLARSNFVLSFHCRFESLDLYARNR